MSLDVVESMPKVASPVAVPELVASVWRLEVGRQPGAALNTTKLKKPNHKFFIYSPCVRCPYWAPVKEASIPYRNTQVKNRVENYKLVPFSRS